MRDGCRKTINPYERERERDRGSVCRGGRERQCVGKSERVSVCRGERESVCV